MCVCCVCCVCVGARAHITAHAAQSYADVSRERRHQAAVHRAHQERLKRLARLNHESAALMQHNLFEPNPLRRSRAPSAADNGEGARLPPRRQRALIMKQLIAANKQRRAIQEQEETAGGEGGGDDDLEDMVARKLTRKDLPLLFVEPQSRWVVVQ